MRDESGRVLLMDFGLSQNLLAGSGWSGTPAYMAPEVAAGQAATAQSDLYSMGVLLRFLTTGLVAPSAPVPARLAGIVKRATETEARLRYASAAQMGAELAGLLEAKAEPEKRERKESKEKKDKEPATFWGNARKYGIAVIVLGFVFGPRLWTKLRETGASVVRPGYQDYLAANEALGRYDVPGNTGKAIGLYESAMKQEPTNALAEAGLARAYWRQYEDTNDAKWADEAGDASAKAMTMNPNLAPVQMTVGEIHVAQGKFDVGMQELEKAVELDPRSAEAHAALAEAYRQQERPEDAKKEFRQAMDLDDENWRWPYQLGAMQIEAGDFKGAEENLKAALEKTPENARVLYNLAIVYVQQDRLSEAQETLQKSIGLDTRTDPILLLGEVYVRQGDYRSAIATYKRAVKLRPDQYDAWGNLALAYRDSRGDAKAAAEAFGKAIGLAQEALKRTPEDPYVVSVLARYYANVQDAAHALPLMRKAILLAPKDPDVTERVAESYEDLGRRREALEFMGKALQLGYSAKYAKADPIWKALRSDPDAPPAIRETDSAQKNGGNK